MTVLAKLTSQSKPISSCKSALIAGALGCLLVFSLNLAILIWAFQMPRGGYDIHDLSDYVNADEPGLRVLYEGSCTTSDRLNTFMHLGINILSTILLATSNYAIQCLSAPTRPEIDEAHSNQQWLDVGIVSVRNMSRLPTAKIYLWWLLMLSSLPIHLL